VPDFKNISEGFMVTLFATEEVDKVTDRVTDRVTDNQRSIVDLLRENSKYTTAELAQKVGISQRKIKENLRKLKEMGLLKRIGSAKGGYWKVNQ